MEKELYQQLIEVLQFNDIEFTYDKKLYVLHLENNEIFVTEIEDIITMLKINNENNLKKKYYDFEEFLNLGIDITKIIEENYKIYLSSLENIEKYYNDFVSYLLISHHSKEDKELLEEIINYTYKFYVLNINENYGLTFMNPFTKKIALTLVNLKTGICYNEISDIVELILKDYHKNRVKFRNTLDYNLEKIEGKKQR